MNLKDKIAQIRKNASKKVEKFKEKVFKKRDARIEKLKSTTAVPATKVSNDGIDFIASHEGFRSCAYKPVSSEQYWTIGYGHYGPDVKSGDCISKSEAIALLRKDVAGADAVVHYEVHVRLNQNQYDALVSFVFNVGAGAFRSSTLLRELNAGNYDKVPSELLRWTKDNNGNVLPGLVTRRKDEGSLFTRK